jgi:hypothetical protein
VRVAALVGVLGLIAAVVGACGSGGAASCADMRRELEELESKANLDNPEAVWRDIEALEKIVSRAFKLRAAIESACE